MDADSFIQELPQGYDAPVSERGSSFSTGQRQLLAFARTVASQPKILILDEATANIDSETESLVQVSLAKMRLGRTTMLSPIVFLPSRRQLYLCFGQGAHYRERNP